MILGFFTDPMLGNPSLPAFRHPAVRVEINGRLSIGMLDTGADLCRLDTGLFGHLPDAGTMPSTLSGHQMVAPMVNAAIRLPAADFSLTGACPLADMRAGGATYDAILGMDFLRFFRLRLDAKAGAVSMEFLGVG